MDELSQTKAVEGRAQPRSRVGEKAEMARAADFRMSCGVLRHPKVIKLRRKLGADGVLSWIGLISFCAQYRTSGSLSGMDGEEIAIASDWSSDAQLFVNALIEIGLLDRDSSGVLSMHDWVEHNAFAAGFEERSARARRASASRWADDGDDARQSECSSDASGNAPSDASSNSPSPPFSGSNSNPPPKTLLPESSAATSASPEAEFKDSAWLISFLKEQTTFNGNLLPKLIHHDFWADVSDVCNGIDANFLRVEFARIAIWIRDNPRRAPTPKGIRRFVAGWLQRAAEQRRRKVAWPG